MLLGVFWVVVALVVPKFNTRRWPPWGVLTGIMFLVFAAEEFLLAALDQGTSRWVWAIFGVLLTAAGIWTVQAFAERVFNDLWWLTLISGILMVRLAFWVSGQFFLTRAATLLVFAGIWALVKGTTDIVRAFQLRQLASS